MNRLNEDDNAISSPDIGKQFIRCGNVQCVIRNDGYYKEVREYYGFGDNFAESSFSFEDLRPSTGKGGTPLCLTNDNMFYIKELTAVDHKTIDNPLFAKELCRHIVQAPSLIAPIVAHFLNPDDGNHYIAMLNVLISEHKWDKVYDLKGCADDRLVVNDGERVEVVRKRFYKVHMWLGVSWEKRKLYKNGKIEALHSPFIPMTNENKTAVLEAIERDSAFLTQMKLMDYSLIVGVTSSAEEDFHDFVPESPIYSGKPLRCSIEDEEKVVFVGIIDYLQKWNGAKVAAQMIKFLEHNKATVHPKKYGERFARHFEHAITVANSPEGTQRRRLPHRCFPCSRQ